jgi:hypothetical protein
LVRFLCTASQELERTGRYSSGDRGISVRLMVGSLATLAQEEVSASND